MANWFYFNKNGEKVGPISATALKALAQQGLITPETKIENSNGRSAVAGKVNGLEFPESPKETILELIPETKTPPIIEKAFTEAEQEEIEKFCKMHGTNVKKADKDGNTLLFKAAANGNIAVVRHLVEQGADVNVRNNYGATPLHNAFRYFDIVLFLVSQGADVNAKSQSGLNPLAGAIGAGNIESVKFLVSQGAEVNLKRMVKDVLEGGDTLLHTAARFNKNDEIVKFLVSQGANVNAQNDNGDTPLEVAMVSEKTKRIAEYLRPLTTVQSTGAIATLRNLANSLSSGAAHLRQRVGVQQSNSTQLPVIQKKFFTLAYISRLLGSIICVLSGLEWHYLAFGLQQNLFQHIRKSRMPSAMQENLERQKRNSKMQKKSNLHYQ